MRIITLTAAALALTAGVAAAAPFGLTDRNDDGSVSKTEFVRIYGPELDAFSFTVIDGNNDGMIDAAEYAEAQTKPNGLLVEGD